MRKILLLAITLIANTANAQVLINEANNKMLQNFGASNISAWSNNSTFTGWYASQSGGTFGVTNLNITATAPTNTGGFYSYRCSGGSDQKIGSRPSGTTGAIYYGLRIKNTSASTIKSLEINYDYFQFSLAENDGNLNTNIFSYKVSSSAITDLTSGTYTNFSSLNFSQFVGDTGGNSAQLLGYPCSQSGNVSSCLLVDIPANSEIMLRFTDVNDAANDHHMGIDNFSVVAHIDNVCLTPLPVVFSAFDCVQNNNVLDINWSTSLELNNSYFEVEESTNGIDFETIKKINGTGNSNKTNNYSISVDLSFKGKYYRIKQVDANGNFTFSKLVYFEPEINSETDIVQFYPNPSTGFGSLKLVNNSEILIVKIFNAFGQEMPIEIVESTDNDDVLLVNYKNYPTGLYYAIVQTEAKIINKSLLVY
ncbi:MAG: T9SS type A sorting domain-containing protein [Bacteroidota bacterium]